MTLPDKGPCEHVDALANKTPICVENRRHNAYKRILRRALGYGNFYSHIALNAALPSKSPIRPEDTYWF